MPYFIMAVFVLIVQVGALWLSETEYITSQTPDNPESIGYSIYYIIVLLIFSAVMVYMIKKNKTAIIRAVIYFFICSMLFFIFLAILDKAAGYTYFTLGVSFVGAVALTILLYKYPEWYIIDIAGLLIAIGSCAVIGVSLSYVPIIVLMVGLLIYDFISVYKTKHMLTLANGMMNLKLPILFVIPKKWNYSYIKEDFSDDDEISNDGGGLSNDDGGLSGGAESAAESASVNETAAGNAAGSVTENVADAAGSGELTGIAKVEKEINEKKSDALFMGLGDAVIPTLLVISANHFLPHDGWIGVPALFTMVGTFFGFALLMYVVSKGKPQAGLPFLNTGAILGFVVGILVSGTAVTFSIGF
ncbi:MAG: presenilin family intramembrane aspartyl protease [Methanimicrococcus sp.]|nr:presenilin family intramembrane aspartyl protease [Methanimicrococcus sp.]